MSVEILETAGYALLAEVRLDGEILGVMDNFSCILTEELDLSKPEFSYLDCDHHTWEDMFGGNPDGKKELVRTGDWSYLAYGQITSIQPVTADFGLFSLELGDITKDARCVGQWIVERIERLDLTFGTRGA